MNHNIDSFNQIAHILHAQAWERAKGELRGMLCTTWPDYKTPSDDYDRFKALVDEFVKTVESEGFDE